MQLKFIKNFPSLYNGNLICYFSLHYSPLPVARIWNIRRRKSEYYKQFSTRAIFILHWLNLKYIENQWSELVFLTSKQLFWVYF